MLTEDEAFSVPLTATILSDEEYNKWEADGGVHHPELRLIDTVPLGHTLKATRGQGAGTSTGKTGQGSAGLLGDLGMTLGDVQAMAKTQRKGVIARQTSASKNGTASKSASSAVGVDQ